MVKKHACKAPEHIFSCYYAGCTLCITVKPLHDTSRTSCCPIRPIVILGCISLCQHSHEKDATLLNHFKQNVELFKNTLKTNNIGRQKSLMLKQRMVHCQWYIFNKSWTLNMLLLLQQCWIVVQPKLLYPSNSQERLVHY